MEIGPRSGGHFVPRGIKYATGFDMVSATPDVFTGNNVRIPQYTKKCSTYYAIHSDNDGILEHLEINQELSTYIKEFHQYVFPGERVNSFRGANATIGVLLLQFSARDEMDYYISTMDKYINLEIKQM